MPVRALGSNRGHRLLPAASAGVGTNGVSMLWQFMHNRLPLTVRPSTVVPGAALLTQSMPGTFGRLCGS